MIREGTRRGDIRSPMPMRRQWEAVPLLSLVFHGHRRTDSAAPWVTETPRTKEGRYLIALPMRGQWETVPLRSLAHHGHRRTDSAAPWVEGGATDQGGAISDRPAHEWTMGSGFPPLIGSPWASAERSPPLLGARVRQISRIIAMADLFVMLPLFLPGPANRFDKCRGSPILPLS